MPAMRDIFEIVRDLKDRDWQTRRGAVQELHRGADERAIPLFNRMLKDGQRQVREAAAEALAAIGDWQAAEDLMEALSDTDEYVRYYAAIALGRMRYTEAVPQLMKRLRDVAPFVRERAAWALGELADKRAIPGLIRMMQKDPFLENERAAARALGELGAEEQLLQMVGGTDPFTRRYAEEVLRLLADVSGREPSLAATQPGHPLSLGGGGENVTGYEPAGGVIDQSTASDKALAGEEGPPVSGREPAKGREQM